MKRSSYQKWIVEKNEKSKTNILKKALRKAVGCRIQHTGWPCGTCFFSIGNGELTNEDWQVVLWVRGDYDASELDNLPRNIKPNIEKILQLCN